MIRNGLSVNRGISAPKDVVNIESLEFLKDQWRLYMVAAKQVVCLTSTVKATVGKRK